VLVACVLAHIAISPILIFGFGPLPALGAAWGLVLPLAVGGAWFVWYLYSGRALVRLSFRGATPRWGALSDRFGSFASVLGRLRQVRSALNFGYDGARPEQNGAEELFAVMAGLETIV
jgi:Na+-driven multidrug efflux pump